MEDDFPVETMSVELAIQRELAYRRKLALDLGSDHDLFKHLIPLQAQSSILSSGSSNSSATKRKEPSSGFEPRHQQPPIANHPSSSFENQTPQVAAANNALIISTNLRCDLCSVLCSSQSNLEQHLGGQKHQAKLQEFAKGQHRWCQVCQIPCTDHNGLKMHFQGKKHKAKLVEQWRSSSSVSTTGREIVLSDPAKLYCNQCRVWCIDESSFKQHLQGRKHRLQEYRA